MSVKMPRRPDRIDHTLFMLHSPPRPSAGQKLATNKENNNG